MCIISIIIGWLVGWFYSQLTLFEYSVGKGLENADCIPFRGGVLGLMQKCIRW